MIVLNSKFARLLLIYLLSKMLVLFLHREEMQFFKSNIFLNPFLNLVKEIL